MGADLVGGVPYNDTDAHRHIAIVFDLAAEFGVNVDFHADFFDEPQHRQRGTSRRRRCNAAGKVGWRWAT